MDNEFQKMIKELCGINESGEALGAPDGIIDASSIIDHLKYLTQEGRAVKSDEPGALMEMLGNWQQNRFGGGTVEDLQSCVVAQNMLQILVLRQVQKLKPDVCPEEILMEVCNQDVLKELAKDMEVTAYRLDENREISIDYFGHEVFHAPFVIDDLVKHSFIRRHITRSFYTDDAEPEFSFEIVEVEENETPNKVERPPNQKVNLNDFKNLIADGLNGFDEFYEQFWQGDFPLIELGIEFDDLPPFNGN